MLCDYEKHVDFQFFSFLTNNISNWSSSRGREQVLEAEKPLTYWERAWQRRGTEFIAKVILDEEHKIDICDSSSNTLEI
jgi:hypothetical protein